MGMLMYSMYSRAKPLTEGQRWLILAGHCVLVVLLCYCVVARALLGTLLVEKSILAKSKG
jgi:hypothetical protein